jgi:hypothetical protein
MEKIAKFSFRIVELIFSSRMAALILWSAVNFAEGDA